MNVLFLAPYPASIAPSQRFRFEHYLLELENQGISFIYTTFICKDDYKLMLQSGNTAKKIFIVFKGYIKRILTLGTLKRYNYIFIHREASPVGPPVLEWIIAKILKKKIIYDFDDAIWIPVSSNANPYASKIKCAWKVSKICSWSYKVTTGNQFLANYARQYCKDTIIIPTVVDTDNVHNKTKKQEDVPLTIGWTGTFTNFNNLNLAISAIQRLQHKYSFVFLIIADKDPELKNIAYTFTAWHKETEINDLLKMHIGIMPLINTDVELGKCAFKAIQYMSLGIPAVVSPVGANCEVVDDKKNGYWADTDHEWYVALEKLILDINERKQMGKLAQQKIINEYSVIATKTQFLDLFKSGNAI
jgi:glycosyltransferase involved in cell wall biosynthesis